MSFNSDNTIELITQALDLEPPSDEISNIKFKLLAGLYHTDQALVNDLLKANLQGIAQRVMLQDFNPKLSRIFTPHDSQVKVYPALTARKRSPSTQPTKAELAAR